MSDAERERDGFLSNDEIMQRWLRDASAHASDQRELARLTATYIADLALSMTDEALARAVHAELGDRFWQSFDGRELPHDTAADVFCRLVQRWDPGVVLGIFDGLSAMMRQRCDADLNESALQRARETATNVTMYFDAVQRLTKDQTS